MQSEMGLGNRTSLRVPETGGGPHSGNWTPRENGPLHGPSSQSQGKRFRKVKVKMNICGLLTCRSCGAELGYLPAFLTLHIHPSREVLPSTLLMGKGASGPFSNLPVVASCSDSTRISDLCASKVWALVLLNPATSMVVLWANVQSYLCLHSYLLLYA